MKIQQLFMRLVSFFLYTAVKLRFQHFSVIFCINVSASAHLIPGRIIIQWKDEQVAEMFRNIADTVKSQQASRTLRREDSL